MFISCYKTKQQQLQMQKTALRNLKLVLNASSYEMLFFFPSQPPLYYWKKSYDGCEEKSGSKNVHCLGKLLNNVAPKQAYNAEKHDNNSGKALSSCLTLKILEIKKVYCYDFVKQKMKMPKKGNL